MPNLPHLLPSTPSPAPPPCPSYLPLVRLRHAHARTVIDEPISPLIDALPFANNVPVLADPISRRTSPARLPTPTPSYLPWLAAATCCHPLPAPTCPSRLPTTPRHLAGRRAIQTRGPDNAPHTRGTAYTPHLPTHACPHPTTYHPTLLPAARVRPLPHPTPTTPRHRPHTPPPPLDAGHCLLPGRELPPAHCGWRRVEHTHPLRVWWTVRNRTCASGAFYLASSVVV